MPLRLQSGGRSLDGVQYTIEIYDSLWSGGVTDFQTDKNLFILQYQGQNEDRFNPILSSSLTINMLVQEGNASALETFIQDLALNSNELRFTVLIERNGTAYWRGVLLIDRVIKELAHYPYKFQIRFTDGLGRLKEIEYNDNGTAFTGRQTFIEHLFNCLDKTGVHDLVGSTDQFLKTYVDWWAEEHSYIAGDDPLRRTRLDNKNFLNVDTNGFINYINTYNVLEQILIAWGARLIFSGGVFWVIQVNDWNNTNKTIAQYTKTQTQSNASFTSQEPKKLLATTGNEISPDLKLKAKTGFIEWFPPLQKVFVDYKHYSQRNIISGQDIITSAWSFPDLDSNGQQTRLIFTGTIELRMNLSVGTSPMPYFRKYGISVGIGPRFLKRAATISNGAVEFDRAMTWVLSTAYYEVYSPVLFTTDDPVYIPVEFITPGIPVDGNLLISVVQLGSFDLQGNSLDTADYGADESILNAYLEILTTGKFEDQANITRYETINGTTGNSKTFETETTIGQGPHPNSFSAIQVRNGSGVWENPTGWRPGNSGDYQNFSQLLANEIMAGQVDPKEKLTAHIIGDYDPHEILVDGSLTRMFNGGKFNAAYDRWEGEWFELGYSTVWTQQPPRNYRKTKDLETPVVDPPTPIIVSGGVSGSSPLSERKTPYEQSFFNVSGDRVTVTVNNGVLPFLRADLVVQLNGNDQTIERDYTISNSDIVFVDTLEDDFVKVKFVF